MSGWLGTETNQLPQAAVEEGIVPGGGVALLYGSRELEEIKGKSMSFDQKIGVDIVQKALLMPLKTIASNAGALHNLHLPCYAVQGLCTLMLLRDLHVSILRVFYALGRCNLLVRTSAVRAAAGPVSFRLHN